MWMANDLDSEGVDPNNMGYNIKSLSPSAAS